MYCCNIVADGVHIEGPATSTLSDISSDLNTMVMIIGNIYKCKCAKIRCQELRSLKKIYVPQYVKTILLPHFKIII